MKNCKSFQAVCFLVLILLSCTKNDKPDPSAASKFSWTYNGTTYVAIQHTAYLSGLGAPSVIAGLQVYSPTWGSGPTFNLTSLQQGTYALTSGGGNKLRYVDEAGDLHSGTAGSLNITNNSGNLLSGNFSVTLTNNKTITGDFTNTTIKP